MASQKTMTAIIKLAGKVDGSLLKSMSTAERRMSAMKKAGAAVGAGVAAATAVAVKQIGKSIDKATEYQTQYAKVKTLLSDGTDFDAYSKQILQASTQTGIATESLTETVYQAISASVDQADAIQFAGTAAKLAKGGFSDSATAVDVLTTALNAYGKESGLTAESVSDLLITTQNLGKTTVNDLAGSIGKVIPVAKTYGVSMANLTTSYAILTKNGISTAESTTYLRSMMNELGKTSSGVSKLLVEKTGKNFAQLQASGKDLYDVIDVLSESVDGDSTAFANLWSNQRAGMGALALLNAGSKEFNKTLKAMEESSGATSKAAGTMGDTYASAKNKIDNAMKNMQIAVGNKFAPIMTQMAEEVMPKVQDAVVGAMDALDGVDLTQFADDAARLAGTVFDGVTGFFTFVGDHKSEIAGVAVTVGVMAAGIGAMSAAAGAVSVIQTLAGAAGAIGASGAAAGAGLAATAAGETAAGAAAAVSAPQLLAMGAAVLMVGGGVALAASGLYMISQGAVSISSAGPAAGVAMVGMVAGLAALGTAAALAGPALTAGSAGMLAFGGATLMAGTGVMLASNGIASLAAQMPMLSSYGPGAASAIMLVSTSSLAAAPGIGALALACAPASLALAAFALAATPVGAAMSAFGWGVQAAAQNIMPLNAGLAASQATFAAWSAGVGGSSARASAVLMAALASMSAAVAATKLTIPTVKVEAMPHFRMSGKFDAVSGSVPTLSVSYYANGGFTNGPIAIAGEAGTEAVISFDPRYRKQNIGYWLQAGLMLGAIRAYAEGGFTESVAARDISDGTVLSVAAASSSGSSANTVNLGGVTFAPVITVSGDTSADVVEQIRQAGDEFFDMLDDWAMEREADYAPVF